MELREWKGGESWIKPDGDTEERRKQMRVTKQRPTEASHRGRAKRNGLRASLRGRKGKGKKKGKRKGKEKGKRKG